MMPTNPNHIYFSVLLCINFKAKNKTSIDMTQVAQVFNPYNRTPFIPKLLSSLTF
jgi:hypothetical protein